jgi:peptide methionine sulfoxide reductase msrA/msrB
MNKKNAFVLIFVIVLVAASLAANYPNQKAKQGAGMAESQKSVQVATFAGGCFWCTQADFEKVPGVVKVVSGYAGGHGPNPTYQNYADKSYVEAVQVYYDPAKVSYQKLLDYFWRHVDPTDAGGQFVDRGPQYLSVIYYHDAEQQRLAEDSKDALTKSGRFHKPIVTAVVPFTNFYPAEEYHQDYYKKNPLRYKYYRWHSGRDQFLEKVWGEKRAGDPPADPPGGPKYTKPSDAELHKILTPLQYRVNTGTTTGKAFTWISLPANRCSVPRISSNPAPAGRVSPNPWCPATSWKKKTAAGSPCAPKSRANTATPTWGTSSKTGRRPHISATA